LIGGKIDGKSSIPGQLGDQQTSLLAVMRGDLEMAGDGAPSWFADLGNMPKMGVLNAAYIFKDLDHMYSVMNSPLVKGWFDELASKTGMRVLDTWYLGMRQLNTTEKAGPVYKPEDLKGMKIRMPNNEASWTWDVNRAIQLQWVLEKFILRSSWALSTAKTILFQLIFRPCSLRSLST
jgi:TRAP-type C4-dicarboxylate transport system substrate-binding protein